MSKKIPVVESFGPTIQGEGIMCGVQTYFIRFGLCDYRCVMCDSMHAVDPLQVKANASWLEQSAIFDYFTGMTYKAGSTKWITYSGGNPCIHDLGELTQNLKDAGFKIAVETQGTKCPEWLSLVDMVTISPKGPGMGEQLELSVLYDFVDKLGDDYGTPFCMKVVVFDQRDLEVAKELIQAFENRGDIKPERDFFLSLGNPYPPGYQEEHHPESFDKLVMGSIGRYQYLFEDIQTDPILSRVKYLPQLHHWVWGNEKGR